MERLLNKIVPISTQYAKNVFIWLITSSSNRITALLFAWCINQQYRFEVYIEGGGRGGIGYILLLLGMKHHWENYKESSFLLYSQSKNKKFELKIDRVAELLATK